MVMVTFCNHKVQVHSWHSRKLTKDPLIAVQYVLLREKKQAYDNYYAERIQL